MAYISVFVIAEFSFYGDCFVSLLSSIHLPVPWLARRNIALHVSEFGTALEEGSLGGEA